MLSPTARPYIAASVPVLREHGLAITSAFYRNLFGEYPELKNLFNMGNQAQGTQQQSLAAAVFAYAANIDNAAALKPVVDRIVHKHASLGIQPEHYPIVGRHLLAAIRQVLGDAATAPLLAAWGEAYGLLADTLVAQEKVLYQSSSKPAGELLRVKVSQIRHESENVKSFTLVAPDGKPLLPFRPGQYISVAVDFADGSRQLRQYSLSDAPARPHYRITVKRENGGSGNPSGQVSNWLHANVKVGDTLSISPPFGDFAPAVDADEPLVLLSAGVGITPMIATLNHLAHQRPGHAVIFAHAARSKLHHSHIIDMETALESMPNLRVVAFYEVMSTAHRHEPNIIAGEMQIADIPLWSRETANVYLCGPIAFMKEQWQRLLDAGVPRHRLHREVFGPDLLDHLI